MKEYLLKLGKCLIFFGLGRNCSLNFWTESWAPSHKLDSELLVTYNMTYQASDTVNLRLTKVLGLLYVMFLKQKLLEPYFLDLFKNI